MVKGVISEMGHNSWAPGGCFGGEGGGGGGAPSGPGPGPSINSSSTADEKLAEVGAGESPGCKHLLPVA